MLPLLAYGALSSMMGQGSGGGGGGGGGWGPSFDAGTQTSASGAVESTSGVGWNVQSSPFTINAGGSTMEDSGATNFTARQDYAPVNDLTGGTATATPTKYTADKGSTLNMPSSGFSLSSVPKEVLYVGAGLLALVIILPLFKRGK